MTGVVRRGAVALILGPVVVGNGAGSRGNGRSGVGTAAVEGIRAFAGEGGTGGVGDAGAIVEAAVAAVGHGARGVGNKWSEAAESS